VAALTLGSLPPLRLLLVAGRAIVEDGEVRTVDAEHVARTAAEASRVLALRLAP